MKIFSWNELENSCESFYKQGSALTIGSFVGPHQGHESLFVSVIREASENGFVPGIVTFTRPLPGFKYLDEYPGDIATLKQRLTEYEKKGFEFALVIDFDVNFSRIEGSTFFKILMEKLNLKCIVEGVDFRCGFGGKFDRNQITAFGLENNIRTVFINLVKTEGERVSSSIIRKLIQKGDFQSVNVLLKRDFVLENEAWQKIKIEGDGEGKEKIIIDKKNLKQVTPLEGTYQVLVEGTFPAVLKAEKDILILEKDDDLNKSDTFNRIKEVCCTKPFVINFPKPGN